MHYINIWIIYIFIKKKSYIFLFNLNNCLDLYIKHILIKQNTISRQELVKQINLFREKERDRTELGHNDLLKIIRDEFEEEISLRKISQREYSNSRGQTYPMFVLTISQSKQLLVRESKFVCKLFSILRKIDLVFPLLMYTSFL